MPEIFDIVNAKSIELVNNIRANLGASGQNATLRTSQSLRFELKQEGTGYKMQLFGRPFFNTVETGRKPTPDKKPSREMIANIGIWAAARGMDERAVWAIATKIQKKGTQLWRDGGRTDIVEPAVDTFINDVSTAILDKEADNFILKVKDGFSS
jgi:hypothetical protein